MPVNTKLFRQAIADTTPRPKAVSVTPGLFRELVAENAIEDRLGTPGGLDAPIFGVDLPFYDGDVFVACDPRLEDQGVDFKLP
jgi:hypothetical protein